MNGENDNEVETVMVRREQLEALVAAGNLVSELWGDLAAGEALTLADVDLRIEDAGLAARFDGVTMISPVLTDAVVECGVALGRLGADDSGADDFEDDVEAAERGFADAEMAEP